MGNKIRLSTKELEADLQSNYSIIYNVPNFNKEIIIEKIKNLKIPVKKCT